MTEFLIHIEDPRLAYIYIKNIIGHENSTFNQKYRAIELLALASNCSRHINIEKKGFVDILRNDFEMENQVNYLLHPEKIQGF